jgi:tRNA threonylcarbamoyladenosine biosynthesis protein TsaB
MYVLALDTTTRDGSVALVDDTGSLDVRRGDGTRSQAERLPAELLELAAKRGLPLAAIDLFAVASGPGSYTGLRIGIATVQGLSLATGRRMVAVSALEALAQVAAATAAPGAFVGAWMDGRRREVFAALYQVVDAPEFSPERLVAVEAPTAGGPESTLDRWDRLIGDAPAVYVGDGAALYREIVLGARRSRWAVVPDPPLLAGAIGRIALARAARGETIDPAAAQPLYVRRPDVELERERRALTDAS